MTKKLKAKNLQKNKKYQVQKTPDKWHISGKVTIEIVSATHSHLLYHYIPGPIYGCCSKEEFNEKFEILKEVNND